jgi:hypothetical protein
MPRSRFSSPPHRINGLKAAYAAGFAGLRGTAPAIAA